MFLFIHVYAVSIGEKLIAALLKEQKNSKQGLPKNINLNSLD
jgi:hypothetical protein